MNWASLWSIANVWRWMQAVIHRDANCKPFSSLILLCSPHSDDHLVKTRVLCFCVPRWRIWWYARVYQSRDETESLCRPDLNSSIRCIIPYYYGSESSSLYTCNTSWCRVHYMILNKPLVRLTTADYQCAVSMISFAQVLTVQWSDTIPCRNVRFQVGITSHNIPFQHTFPWGILCSALSGCVLQIHGNCILYSHKCLFQVCNYNEHK